MNIFNCYETYGKGKYGSVDFTKIGIKEKLALNNDQKKDSWQLHNTFISDSGLIRISVRLKRLTIFVSTFQFSYNPRGNFFDHQ